MDVEILIPLGFFALIGAIILVPTWLKSRERREVQELLRTAIDKGQPLPAEALDALTKNVKTAPSAFSDVRAGVIWLAIGLGIGAFGFIIGFTESDAFHPILGIGAIPAIIGLAYIILSFVNPNKGKA